MEQNGDLKLVQAVKNAQSPEDNTITLSTGVVLLGKQVPPLVLVKIMAQFPRPKVPTYNSKEMGREVENPDDPDYLERVKSWKLELSNATLNALVLLGTELVSIPKKFPKPSDDDWVSEYSLLGVSVRAELPAWRYLTWIIAKAAPATEDLNLIKEVVGRLSGITEAKVEAAESFPDGDKAPG